MVRKQHSVYPCSVNSAVWDTESKTVETLSVIKTKNIKSPK